MTELSNFLNSDKNQANQSNSAKPNSAKPDSAKQLKHLSWLFSVAPMLDWTDKHCRYFHRLIHKDVMLYSEMITTGAIIHGRRDQLLNFNASEQPVALQIGGENPEALKECAIIGAGYGYDEINLNCGCPSDRVQSGAFGAVLMKDPAKVAKGVEAMKSAVDVPVTVKCRIGVDESDEWEDLSKFAKDVINAGADALIVHARKAWLKGLSPKENRDIPPLNYERVYALKNEFPAIPIIINGGIKNLETVSEVMNNVDGVMIGREAYHNPRIIYQVGRKLFDNVDDELTKEDAELILNKYKEYAIKEEAKGIKPSTLIKPILGIYHAQPGGKVFRSKISQALQQKKNITELFAAIDIK